MRGPHPTSNFLTLSKAEEAAGIAISVVSDVRSPLKSLADQVVRSASSVPANLAEGAGRTGRDRLYHWKVAYGSAKEADTHLGIPCLFGAAPRGKAIATLDLSDKERGVGE